MNDKEQRLKNLEKQMESPSFWEDSASAQKIIKEYNDLKNEENPDKNAKAVIAITAGAGGDDAEDFARMLFDMYRKYCEKKGYPFYVIEEHRNVVGGIKNITAEIDTKGAYQTLRNETGVHRLVRISPFNAKKQRHTSFAHVEVIPKLPPLGNVNISDSDLKIEFSNSGGPGGQNVNKRETAVRIAHEDTGISVRVESERSQAQNKERALEIIRGKLFTLLKKERVEKIKDLSSNKHGTIEWGSQIRSYVLHPYQLVKDLRVQYEERNPESVLDGELDGFIQALADYDGM